MGDPAVSIFMPTYNQSDYLPYALEGLSNQELKDFELIVVDDNSSDGTRDILERSVSDGLIQRVIFRSSNSGTAAAPINNASRFARGQYWTWVSSDNVMSRDWLRLLIDEFYRDSKLGAAFSAFRRIQNGRTSEIRRPHGYRREDLIGREECYIGPSFLIDAEIWRAVGDHRDGTAHDYDHWLRVEEECWRRGRGLKYVDEILCDYNAGEHQTVRRNPHLYNAPKYQKAAKARRGSLECNRVVCKSIAEIDRLTADYVGPAESLLDVGCGIRPQKVIEAARHVGVDIYDPYIERARSAGLDVVRHDVGSGLPFGDNAFEIVWLSDIIEHLEKERGRHLFEEARRVASRGVVVRSPVGFEEQEGDAWGMGGDHWQKHRSGWEPHEFGPEIVWTVPPGVNGKQEWFASFTKV